MSAQTRAAVAAKEEALDTGAGIGLGTLFWLFLTAGLLGDLLETLYVFLVWGDLQSRSSLLYLPLSAVWGLGAVLFTLLFRQTPGWSIPRLFLAGAVAGAGFEYLCSWVQELCFGARFWDYRALPLNLNGRVNLGFSLVWGAAALVWVRLLLPPLCRLFGRCSGALWRAVTLALAAVLCVDAVLTAGALVRMEQRLGQVPASGPVQLFLDRHYPDQLLEARFKNLKFIGLSGEAG